AVNILTVEPTLVILQGCISILLCKSALPAAPTHMPAAGVYTDIEMPTTPLPVISLSNAWYLLLAGLAVLLSVKLKWQSYAVEAANFSLVQEVSIKAANNK